MRKQDARKRKVARPLRADPEGSLHRPHPHEGLRKGIYEGDAPALLRQRPEKRDKTPLQERAKVAEVRRKKPVLRKAGRAEVLRQHHQGAADGVFREEDQGRADPLGTSPDRLFGAGGVSRGVLHLAVVFKSALAGFRLVRRARPLEGATRKADQVRAALPSLRRRPSSRGIVKERP